MLAGDETPDTDLRIKEAEHNIWSHTISVAVAVVMGSVKTNLLHVLASAQDRQAGTVWDYISLGGRT